MCKKQRQAQGKCQQHLQNTCQWHVFFIFVFFFFFHFLDPGICLRKSFCLRHSMRNAQKWAGGCDRDESRCIKISRQKKFAERAAKYLKFQMGENETEKAKSRWEVWASAYANFLSFPPSLTHQECDVWMLMSSCPLLLCPLLSFIHL